MVADVLLVVGTTGTCQPCATRSAPIGAPGETAVSAVAKVKCVDVKVESSGLHLRCSSGTRAGLSLCGRSPRSAKRVGCRSESSIASVLPHLGSGVTGVFPFLLLACLRLGVASEPAVVVCGVGADARARFGGLETRALSSAALSLAASPASALSSAAPSASRSATAS